MGVPSAWNFVSTCPMREQCQRVVAARQQSNQSWNTKVFTIVHPLGVPLLQTVVFARLHFKSRVPNDWTVYVCSGDIFAMAKCTSSIPAFQ